MTVSGGQTAFNVGEISPELYGEVNLDRYSSALTTCRNFVINVRGGAISRGGFATVGVCKQDPASGNPPRPIPFQFSNDQGYVLEFGDAYLRLVFQGGYIVEAPIAITGATQANPCQISVTGTPFANGDWIDFSAVAGMTQLNGLICIVANAAPGSFTLQDLHGNPINSTTFGAYVSGGFASRLYTISTPYAAVDLPYLKVSQDADVMTLTCSNPVNGAEYSPYELTRLAHANWTLEPVSFTVTIAAPTGVAAASSGLAPSGGVNAAFGYVVTSVDGDGNESVASAIAQCRGADLDVEGATNTVTWGPVGAAAFYNIYRGPTQVYTTTAGYTPIPIGSIFGFVGSSFGNQFADSGIARDLQKVPPTHRNPFAQGRILAVGITGPGSGLTTVDYTITTVAGVNFVGTPAVAGGRLGGFPVIDDGHGYAPGDSITLNGAGFATGAVSFGTDTDAVAGATLKLNGVVWTFVTTVTGANQTALTGALSSTLAQLASGLSAAPDAGLIAAAYSTDGLHLLIQYKTAGTAGNAYTMVAAGDAQMTVSGATLTGGSGSGSAGTHATGTVTFSGNPTAAQNIVLDAVTWTFVASGATGPQTNIQGSLAATLTQLAIDLNASTNPSIALATYAGGASTLAVTYKTVGAVGNTYTLAIGTAASAVSGPTLAGGTDASSTPTATLSIGPQSGTYPGVNAYFQQRRFFANSLNNPDTIWATQTGRFSNMDTSIPTIATDAITASPWTEQVNGIQWLIPMPGGLIAMTGLRAWQVIGQGSYQLNVQPITPSTTQAQPQAFNGCSPTVPPTVIDYDVLYVHDTAVFDLSWNFWVNIYTGNDLTILSSHLFLNREIVQWAWARQFYKVMWSVCDDGLVTSLTYLKEQNVYGWARHDTLGLAVGVASVTEPPVNAVYMVVQRFPPGSPNGVYVMERMDNRLWPGVEDAYSVDSGVSNPMASPSAALFASSLSGTVTFSARGAVFSAGSVGRILRMSGGIATVTGFIDARHVSGTWLLAPIPSPTGLPFEPSGGWTISTPVTSLKAPHLAGMQVVGLADGVPIGPLTVGPAPLGTVTLPFAASNVKVGLPFLPQMQLPYLNGPEVVQGARKMIPAATFRVASSGNGFQVGTNQPDGAALSPPQIGPAWGPLETVDTLQPTGGQDPPATYTSPAGEKVTQLWTGDIRVEGMGQSDWNSKGQVCIQMPLPMALEVTGVFAERLDGDSPEAARAERQPSAPPSRAALQGGGGEGGPPGPWMLRG